MRTFNQSIENFNITEKSGLVWLSLYVNDGERSRADIVSDIVSELSQGKYCYIDSPMTPHEWMNPDYNTLWKIELFFLTFAINCVGMINTLLKSEKLEDRIIKMVARSLSKEIEEIMRETEKDGVILMSSGLDASMVIDLNSKNYLAGKYMSLMGGYGTNDVDQLFISKTKYRDFKDFARDKHDFYITFDMILKGADGVHPDQLHALFRLLESTDMYGWFYDGSLDLVFKPSQRGFVEQAMERFKNKA